MTEVHGSPPEVWWRSRSQQLPAQGRPTDTAGCCTTNSPTHGHTAPAGLIPDDDQEEEEEEEEGEEDSKDYVEIATKQCPGRSRKKLESQSVDRYSSSSGLLSLHPKPGLVDQRAH